MKINKETTNLLLSKFVGMEDSNPKTHHFMPTIYNNKKYCCSTNGLQMILIPENNDNKLEEPLAETVNVARVIPETFSKNILVEISHLKQLYDKVELIDQEIGDTCSSCDCNGNFIHAGISYKCKKCNGKGTIGIGKFEKIKNPQSVFLFDGSHLALDHVKNILFVAEKINCTQLYIIQSFGESRPFYIKLDEIIIATTPKFMDEDETYKIVKVI